MRPANVTAVFAITMCVTLLALSLAMSAIYVIQTPAIFWNNVAFTFAMILLITFPTALVVSKMSFDVVVLNKKVRNLIRYDALTGTLNREEFFKDLRQEKSISTGMALMMEVDGFSAIRDEFGFEAADDVLKVIADTMKEAVREDDKVARFGPEEFMIILQSVNLDEGLSVAKRIQQTIAESPVTSGNHAIPVSVSVGAVTIEKNHDIDKIVQMACHELGEAKIKGRNQLQLMRNGEKGWYSDTPQESNSSAPN